MKIVTRFALLVMLFIIFTSIPNANTFAQLPGDCALDPTQISGQGFNVSGQGFNVSGQGFNVSGQGFNVSGQGFNVSGQGFNVSGQQYSLETILAEYLNNFADFDWLTTYITPVHDNMFYDENKEIAVIIIDNELHGGWVEDIFTQADTALDGALSKSTNIRIERISLGDVDYSVDGLAVSLQNMVETLVNEGTTHFVVNMSIALIPCEDVIEEVTLPDGTHPTFNLLDALATIEEENNFDPIVPIVQCVIANDDSTLTAHLGYENPNVFPVYILYGADNAISVGSFTANQLEQATPQYFGVPRLNAGSGVSPDFPYSAFQITFDDTETLTWSLFGTSVSADSSTTPCAIEEAGKGNNGNGNGRGNSNGGRNGNSNTDNQGTVDGTLNRFGCNGRGNSCNVPDPDTVNIFVECVAQLDNGDYVAHFGYDNEINITFVAEVGRLSTLTGGGLSQEVKQVVTPSYFTVPNIIDGEPTRSDLFPNSAFQVIFDGTDLTWTLFNQSTTASVANSPECITRSSYGFGNYFENVLGIPTDQVANVIVGLLEEGSDTDVDLSDLQKLLGAYLERSATDPNFALVPVASAGNFRPFFLLAGVEPLPLAPAKWKEVVAVSAAMGVSDNPWSMSHEGNVRAVGGTYVDSTFPNLYHAGTSFSAPIVSRIFASHLAIPNSCNFVEVAGQVRPPIFNPDVFDNSVITTVETTPFNCELPIGIVPDAQDDSYNIPFGTDQLVDAANGLFVDNGNGADDIGIPLGEIVSFGVGDLGEVSIPAGGSADLAHGTLTVNADGSFSLTGAPFAHGIYTFTYTVANTIGTDTATVTLVVDTPKIVGLQLIDSSQNAIIPTPLISPLTDGIQINISTLPEHISFVALANPEPVGSVHVSITGSITFERVENEVPYTFFGNVIDGDTNNIRGEEPLLGDFTLTATPYTGENGTGTAGEPFTVNISIVGSEGEPEMAVMNTPFTAAVTSYTLINADTDQPIPGYEAISSNIMIETSQLPPSVSIRANVSDKASSVHFALTGDVTGEQTDSTAPFTTFGDESGDYKGLAIPAGTYTLTAVPYADVTGEAGGALSVTFTFVNPTPAAPIIEGAQ